MARLEVRSALVLLVSYHMAESRAGQSPGGSRHRPREASSATSVVNCPVVFIAGHAGLTVV